MNASNEVDRSEFVDPLSNFDPPEYASELQQVFAELDVDAMSIQPYLSISPSTSVREAVGLLNDSKTACLLVVEADRLVGIFTERDVLERVAEQFSRVADHAVADFMTTDPTIVYESDPVATALAAIAIAGHRHVPVLDLDDKVIGVASPRRAFQFMERYI